MLKKLAITFCILMLVVSSLAQSERRPTTVSIVQLIANPKAYQGELVRIVGFVSVKFEGTAVFLHEDDYKYFITKNGLWLDLNGGKPRKEHLEFDGKYVLVEGTFDASMTGHRGAYSGGIKNVKRMQSAG